MRRQGFSMIELMIALGIIGILATLAIPRFVNYRMRTWQTEAKVNLESIKQSETLFNAESNGYTDDLSLLAWRPEGAPRYLYGFTTDERPAASGMNDTAELAAAGKGDYATHGMVVTLGVPLTDADLPPGSVVTGDRYSVGAAANLDGDPGLDQFRIDQVGLLQLVNADVN